VLEVATAGWVFELDLDDEASGSCGIEVGMLIYIRMWRAERRPRELQGGQNEPE
jgi:hypothetical protein